ncbi:hypothetical protein D5S17_18140 [Pseudonocardiaceae bacterium YIM PH 21723]|nr:hypothetical protein D5S17_18140 [Pseudonocardiaceae bacterium YIM PH 21723]
MPHAPNKVIIEPITVNYTPDGPNWTITVTQGSKELKATEPGLIAARCRADQITEELEPDKHTRVVVHTLNGDPIEFTMAYLQARHGVSAAGLITQQRTNSPNYQY